MLFKSSSQGLPWQSTIMGVFPSNWLYLCLRFCLWTGRQLPNANQKVHQLRLTLIGYLMNKTWSTRAEFVENMPHLRTSHSLWDTKPLVISTGLNFKQLQHWWPSSFQHPRLAPLCQFTLVMCVMLTLIRSVNRQTPEWIEQAWICKSWRIHVHVTQPRTQNKLNHS